MRIISMARQALKKYQDSHLRFVTEPHSLNDTSGELAGYVEKLEYTADSIYISGWSLCPDPHLINNDNSIKLKRYIDRGDVISALGSEKVTTYGNIDGKLGFSSRQPWCGGPPLLCGRVGSKSIYWRLPYPNDINITKARRKLIVPFIFITVKNFHLLLAFLNSGYKNKYRDVIWRKFGFNQARSESRIISPNFFRSAKTEKINDMAVIILPVYNAFEVLQECLHRVTINSDLPWHMVIIDDSSSDERIKPFLREFSSVHKDNVTLLENQHNLGFIGSVNRALEHIKKWNRHVVLLNSDALVPKDWLSRILQPIISNSKIATVTPMSNDATIFSVPKISGTVNLSPGCGDAIDMVARSLSCESTAASPTGVGFCMAINKEAIKHSPLLDTVFGKGYGEEVDWCQKFSAKGMQNIGIGNLFVEHRGGQSFGSATKLKAMTEAGRIITKRYPDYDSKVQKFVSEDPLFTARFILSIAHAAAESVERLPIYLAHSLGGGAQKWIDNIIEERCLKNQGTAIIRVGGEYRFRMELYHDGTPEIAETDSISAVFEIFSRISNSEIFYSCGVYDKNPPELPLLLNNIANSSGAPLHMLFHDYLPISPSFNLLESDGTYRGVPNISNVDPKHEHILEGGGKIPLSYWRAAWTQLVSNSKSLIVFSQSSCNIVQTAWPEHSSKIIVKPHDFSTKIPRIPSPNLSASEPLSIGVLGAIGDVKGAEILGSLSKHIYENRPDLRLIIIGDFDRRFYLHPDAIVTGRYTPDQVEELAIQHRIAAWLMPSICPETFSFTVHEIIGTGLPVIAFDIGAQGEAVKKYGRGYISKIDALSILETFTTAISVNHEELIRTP